MKPVSIVWVLAVGLVAAGLSFLGFFAHMREGGTPMIVTPGPAVIFAIATACLIWSGLAVRRLRDRLRPQRPRRHRVVRDRDRRRALVRH